MLDKEELKKFCSMSFIYDQCADVKVWDTDYLETIDKLSDTEHLDSINTLFNEDEEFETADELFEEMFGMNSTDINKLADEFGFTKVNSQLKQNYLDKEKDINFNL